MVYLYIPEQSVGAVIGSKGQNIKNIMHLSAARIKVSWACCCCPGWNWLMELTALGRCLMNPLGPDLLHLAPDLLPFFCEILCKGK